MVSINRKALPLLMVYAAPLHLLLGFLQKVLRIAPLRSSLRMRKTAMWLSFARFAALRI